MYTLLQNSLENLSIYNSGTPAAISKVN